MARILFGKSAVPRLEVTNVSWNFGFQSNKTINLKKRGLSTALCHQRSDQRYATACLLNLDKPNFLQVCILFIISSNVTIVHLIFSIPGPLVKYWWPKLKNASLWTFRVSALIFHVLHFLWICRVTIKFRFFLSLVIIHNTFATAETEKIFYVHYAQTLKQLFCPYTKWGVAYQENVPTWQSSTQQIGFGGVWYSVQFFLLCCGTVSILQSVWI